MEKTYPQSKSLQLCNRHRDKDMQEEWLVKLHNKTTKSLKNFAISVNSQNLFSEHLLQGDIMLNFRNKAQNTKSSSWAPPSAVTCFSFPLPFFRLFLASFLLIILIYSYLYLHLSSISIYINNILYPYKIKFKHFISILFHLYTILPPHYKSTLCFVVLLTLYRI